MKIPEWIDCSRKYDGKTELTALESFVYTQEPVGGSTELFRAQLQAVVDELRREP